MGTATPSGTACSMVRCPSMRRDADPNQQPFASTGLMFALLGAAKADVLRGWFSELSVAGTVVDDLQVRPWGASDGQVIDRFGLLWLIGYEHED